MKIFLVTDGEYSDYHVKGAFSTKEKAEEAIILYSAGNIEEREIDEFPPHPKGMLPYCVQMDIDGNSLVKRKNSQGFEFYEKDKWRPYGNNVDVCFYMWAKDEQHAVKIANERRTELIATNEWNVNLKTWRRQV